MCDDNKISESNWPEKFFHYTSIQSLINIINSSEIWLTDFNFLNDPKEFQFSREAMAVAISQINISSFLTRLRENGANLEQLKSFENRFEQFSNGLYGLELEKEWTGYIRCIACFSDQEDSLPQWRAYGNQEVCIEFSKIFFTNLIHKPGKLFGVKFKQVIYDHPVELQNRLKIAVEAMLSKAVDEIRTQDYQNAFQAWLPDDAGPLFHKNIAFQTEGEWRLAASAVNMYIPGQNNPFNFRSTSGLLAPYCSVPLDLPVDIVGLRFGPGANPALVKYLDKLFFRSHLAGMGEKWKLSISAIPYRSN